MNAFRSRAVRSPVELHERELREFASTWRRFVASGECHLAPLEDEQLAPKQYLSRWGDPHSIEQMLEHAVVHPMRHRIQLERLLSD